MLITIADYAMGRDLLFPAEWTPEIRQNAEETVRRWNLLLAHAAGEGVYPGVDHVTRTAVASGWRPTGINDRTSNAAKLSTHIWARGLDVQDIWPVRPLARWVLRNLAIAEQIGLWFEDPRWTCNESQAQPDPWVHGQTVPPKSGRRVYIPSTRPAMAAALPEQLSV